MLKFLLVLACLYYNCYTTLSLSITATVQGSFDTSGNITIHWEGIPSPSSNDFLALHSTGQTCQTDHAYLYRKSADVSSTYNTGTGDLIFENVLNTRSPFVVRYWSNATIIATSNVVTPNAHYPLQLHLSPTEVTEEMRLTWVTGLSVNASVPQAVYYGMDPSTPQNKVTAVPHTYTVDEFIACNAGTKTSITNFFDPGWIHSAVLGPLLPDTQYYYWIGLVTAPANASAILRGPLSFRSRPDPSSQSIKQTKMLYFADMGIGPPRPYEIGGELSHAGGANNDNPHCGARPVVASILKSENLSTYDVAFHNGDLSYAVGIGTHWDYFHDLIEPISRVLPYLVSVGNHEYVHSTQPFMPPWSNYANDSGGECGIPTVNRFLMPNNFSTSTPWYSVDVGLVHLVVMSFEVNFTVGSPQHVWVEADLAAVNRSRTPWVVAAHHRPMYGNLYPEMESHEAAAMEPLYEMYGVDLVLAGHVHAYYRSCPMLNGTCAGNGIVHVVDGLVGASVQPYSHEDYVVYADNDFGYSRFTATPDSLFFEHIHSDKGNVIDSFTLKKHNELHRTGFSSTSNKPSLINETI